MGPPGFRGEECKILNPGPCGKQGSYGPDGPPGVCGHLEKSFDLHFFFFFL